MKAIKSSGTLYQSPETLIIELSPEGILCASGGDGTESLDETFGNW